MEKRNVLKSECEKSYVVNHCDLSKDDLFKDVLGYDAIKKELKLIRSWLLDKELLKDERITLPSGILFHGAPGCGKTLFLREYSKSFNCPVFVIEGKTDCTTKEINEVFEKARKEELAIVLIDEIDLLIGEDSQIERSLQNELDGINKKGQILVMATTNSLRALHAPLLRKGRFDRLIEVNYPDKKSREYIYEKFLKEFDIDTANINIKHIASLSTRCNGAEIKTICNDVYLRCRNKVTTEDIEESYERIHNDGFSEDSLEYRNMRVAVHEVGPALMNRRYENDFSLYQAKFFRGGGVTITYDVDENLDIIRKREESIRIAFAGCMAEKVIYGKSDLGSLRDLEIARDLIHRLVEFTCVKGLKRFVPSYFDCSERSDTETHKRENEKVINKLMKKYSRESYRYLKKNKKTIIELANKMYESGKLVPQDFQD